MKITYPNPLKWESIGELIEVIIAFLRNTSLLIVPMMIIIAAFYFLTSGGDPNKVKTGKNILVWTIIGTAIILTSSAIITLVQTTIGVKDIPQEQSTEGTIPTPPAENPPAENPPVENPPAENPPVVDPPADGQPF